MKICYYNVGHMTRWLSCPYMVKKPLKNRHLWNYWTDFHEFWYVTQWILAIICFSHYDPWMTLTYFTTSSNFETYAFIQENATMMECFAACGLLVNLMSK